MGRQSSFLILNILYISIIKIAKILVLNLVYLVETRAQFSGTHGSPLWFSGKCKHHFSKMDVDFRVLISKTEKGGAHNVSA